MRWHHPNNPFGGYAMGTMIALVVWAFGMLVWLRTLVSK